MKITSSRREDLIRQKQEYDENAAKLQQEHDEQYDNLSRARREVFNGVAQHVRSQIEGLVGADNLDVYVEEADWEREDGEMGRLRVRVMVNEHRVHAEDKALSWSWEVKLTPSGEIKKDSGSWSGLQACTAEQLEDLRKTLQALEILNDMNWPEILRKELPNYKDYVTTRAPFRGDRPDFEGQIFEAEIEEAIGKPILFQGAAPEYRGWYYAVLSQTEKQYRIVNIPLYLLKEPEYRKDQTVEELIDHYSKFNVQRVMKSKFATMLAKPLTKWED